MSFASTRFRLHDVLHSDKKLTLVFEYCDQVRGGCIYSSPAFYQPVLSLMCSRQDLKKYFDSCNGDLDPETVKVRGCGFEHTCALNTL